MSQKLRHGEFVEILNFKKDLDIVPVQAKVSFYENVTDTMGKPVFLSDVLDGIRDGQWENEISELRSINDEKTQKVFKNSLPCFTASGVFAKRSVEGLVSHSGAIVLDIDGKDNPILSERFDEIRQNLIADKNTLFIFTSCRGNGLAVGIRIDKTKHLENFKFFAQYYEERFGLIIDPGCKDISRLRFISFDPDLYSNEGAEAVIVPLNFCKKKSVVIRPYPMQMAKIMKF